nr:xylulose kinase-1 [Tanacetum cinerariifolium]
MQTQTSNTLHNAIMEAGSKDRPPMLAPGKYVQWKSIIKRYIDTKPNHELIYYCLEKPPYKLDWKDIKDVIENGNSSIPAAQTTTNVDGTSTTLIPGPVTTEEKVQKKNDVKERSMLLMTLPNEHIMTFNQYKDAKTLFAAIQTRFGGNEATKKNQKTLLKQMYENFIAPSTDTNEVNTAYGVSTTNTQVSPARTQVSNASTQVSPASTQVSNASTQVSTANLSDATVYAFLASQPNGSQLVHEDLVQIHKDGLEEIDLKWNQDRRNRNQDSSRRSVNIEETSSKAMAAINRAGFDWSYMADDEVPINMDLMSNSGLEEFQQPKFEGYGPKTSNSVSEDISNEVKESPDAPLIKELVSNDKLEKKTVFLTVDNIEFVKPKQQEKLVRKPVKYAEMYMSQCPRGNQRNWNNQKSQQLGSDFVMYNKACFVCRSFDHVQASCNYHQRESMVSWNNYTRVNYNYFTKKAHPSTYKNIAPRVVLMKTGLRPLNTARHANTTHLKTTLYNARLLALKSQTRMSTV